MGNNRKGKVYCDTLFAGIIEETDQGYAFTYDHQYLDETGSREISLTMPKQSQRYESKTFFPFFDGLIPEGWLLGIAIKNWKLDSRDRMGLLLAACSDCIGNVSVEAF